MHYMDYIFIYQTNADINTKFSLQVNKMDFTPAPKNKMQSS